MKKIQSDRIRTWRPQWPFLSLSLSLSQYFLSLKHTASSSSNNSNSAFVSLRLKTMLLLHWENPRHLIVDANSETPSGKFEPFRSFSVRWSVPRFCYCSISQFSTLGESWQVFNVTLLTFDPFAYVSVSVSLNCCAPFVALDRWFASATLRSAAIFVTTFMKVYVLHFFSLF